MGTDHLIPGRSESMRTNLVVPYAEKDEAWSLGAKWDGARKVWYVEDIDDLKPFLRWIPAHLKQPCKVPPGFKARSKSRKKDKKKNQ